MVNNLIRSSAETSSGNQWTGQRSHNHIDFRGVDILMLRDATRGSSKNTKRPGLVQDQSEFVLELQLNL